jgi:hypothetical protein
MMQNYGDMFSKLSQAGQNQPMGRPFGRPMGMNPQQWRQQIPGAGQPISQMPQVQQTIQGLPQNIQPYAQQALSGQMPQMPQGQMPQFSPPAWGQNRATQGPQVAGQDFGWPFRR